eukprot:CAMPEP_0206213478 /NCGR_PEP_ID=MMETSP0047_2-20121206/1146_1 /ASSEMBLY_ACC=CAM_ASM_000192 /TAXON_ID=195065 /ORGANISM="Chroomonas mesostigmatica_cf, Strain CCMP1168" /LENGTH=70 /DNA_ID=CAMNT_0053635635 /DNA_START=121 /DNA_END=329 /DNA_ORIENTATION=-
MSPSSSFRRAWSTLLDLATSLAALADLPAFAVFASLERVLPSLAESASGAERFFLCPSALEVLLESKAHP